MGLIDLIASSSLSHEGKSYRCIQFLNELFSDYGKNDLGIRLWDGRTWGTDAARCSLVLKHPGTLRRLCTDPSHLSLGEAYIYDDVDIEGDIEVVFGVADRLLELGNGGVAQQLRLMRLHRELPTDDDSPYPERRGRKLAGPLHSRKRDNQAVRYHYDLPADFFALFLDRAMQYSSAFFEGRKITDLDAAQQRKLDYICRKLDLRPGETLLDIGCGWGGLLAYAAAHYRVRAVAITVSVPQAEAARQRIRDAGLNQRCRVEVCDYRDLEGNQLFDKVVSVGMFEHVGREMLPEYFATAWQQLKRRPFSECRNLRRCPGAAAQSILHRSLRLPRRGSRADQQGPWRCGRSRVRGPRHREFARALWADLASMGTAAGT